MRPVEPPPPVLPLPDSLRAEVEQWESDETRGRVERQIRALMDQGMGSEAILLKLDNEHP